jgi:L-alanine-DL-glutamate epimerase-like enolase superfamily enzyme
MKIREVKTYRLDAVLAEPFAYSQAWYDHRGALLVEIISEDGLSGWGEAFGPPLLTAPIVDFYTVRMHSQRSSIGRRSTTGCAIMGRKGWPSRR